MFAPISQLNDQKGAFYMQKNNMNIIAVADVVSTVNVELSKLWYLVQSMNECLVTEHEKRELLAEMVSDYTEQLVKMVKNLHEELQK